VAREEMASGMASDVKARRTAINHISKKAAITYISVATP